MYFQVVYKSITCVVQFGSINILQNLNASFSQVFGSNWEGKLSSYEALMGNCSSCFVFMLSLFSAWFNISNTFVTCSEKTDHFKFFIKTS